MTAALHALVVDDEQPVLDELVWLLERDDRIASVRATNDGSDALRILEQGGIDLVFLDVAMPGLSGLDIARLLGRFRDAPSIVFVTAHEAHAVEAFEMNAVDYLLKPIREERLRESVRRACADDQHVHPSVDEQIAVELGGVTRFISRTSVAHAEAQGDYVRLHVTDGSSHLVRIPLGTLAEEWAAAGFARIHRSLLVNLATSARCACKPDGAASSSPPATPCWKLQVARRHTRTLRDLIHERAL
ncbi:LytR/AlgR family response regulator transcription factor [Aeromicrobium sp. UC242_57]|uniref:LytR/AlgR family response regulator transcription factor n=1 Tax=Aeromicrobium sp. UC242_57 TaxID=3374624 RepID=UPI0037BC5666